MANYNLTNQTISSSFQQLLQKDDATGYLVDGTGSIVDSLEITGSVTASFFKGDGSALTNISADADTGSLLSTASISDATITFTKGDGSTFDITVDNVASASQADNATSASHAVNSLSASHAEFADEATQAEDLFITVKNTSGADIGKGLAVHATGVTGENVNIKLADSDVPADMPAIGLTETAISNNANGRVIINGRLKGVDTSTLVAGSPVYVNGAGTLSATKPTGSAGIQNIGTAAKINASDGEIILQGSGRINDLPNITNGYGWFGNSDGVAEAQTTSSFAKTDINNTFTGTQNFDNISVSGTGSFAYLESVTGSAKIIGDAFIILNNNTPAERYAGIKIQDSGSNTTASLQWDGGTNDWFYEYSASATHEYGVSLFGPEYTTKGTPTYLTNNRVPIGNGGHHLNDSNLEANGSTLSFPPQADATSGNTFFNVNVDSDAGDVFAHISIQDRGVGKNDVQLEMNSYTGLDGSNPVFRLRGGGNSAGGQNNTVLATLSDGSALFYKNSNFVTGTSLSTSGSFVTEGTVNINQGATMAGAFTQSGETLFENNVSQSSGNIESAGTISSQGNHKVNSQFPTFQANGDSSLGSLYGGFQIIDANTTANSAFALTSFSGLDGSNPVLEIQGPNGTRLFYSTITDSIAHFPTLAKFQNGIEITGSVAGITQISNDLEITGSLAVTGNISGSSFNGTTLVSSSAAITNQRVPIGNGGGFGVVDSNMSIEGTNVEFPDVGSEGRFANININVNKDQGTIYGAFKIDNKSTSPSYEADVNIELTDFSGLHTDPVMRFRAGGTGGQNSDTVFAAFTDSTVNWYKDLDFVANTNTKFEGNITVGEGSGKVYMSGSAESDDEQVTISSNTASLDFDTSPSKTLTLVSGSDTRIEVTGNRTGQTMTLLVKQPGTGYGTVTIGSPISEPNGNFYTASQSPSAEDVLTFTTFGGTTYMVNAINFIAR